MRRSGLQQISEDFWPDQEVFGSCSLPVSKVAHPSKTTQLNSEAYC